MLPSCYVRSFVKRAGVDKVRIAQHFSDAVSTYSACAEVQHAIADGLVARMRECGFPQAAKVYEVGAGMGCLTERVLRAFLPVRLVANDLCDVVADPLRALSGVVEFVSGDAETLPVPEGCEHVVSGAAVQWFFDVEQFFCRVARHLPENGFLAFSTFGPDNFHEVRAVSGIGLDYRSLSAYRTMLESCGLTVLCADAFSQRLTFPNAAGVLRHIRETGTGGVVANRWQVAQTYRFCREYEARFACEGGVALTYHPLLVVAVKREVQR